MPTDQPTKDEYREILETHRELLQLIDRIDHALAERSLPAEEVVAMLGQLGDRLVKHFAFEEDGGYFAEALTGAPQLIAAANDLLRQHPRMSAAAQDLVAATSHASGSGDWWNVTRTRFRAFRAELVEHEQCEDRLVQEALQRDVGAAD